MVDEGDLGEVGGGGAVSGWVFWLDLGKWRDGWRGRLTFRNTPYLRCRTSGLPQVPL